MKKFLIYCKKFWTNQVDFLMRHLIQINPSEFWNFNSCCSYSIFSRLYDICRLHTDACYLVKTHIQVRLFVDTVGDIRKYFNESFHRLFERASSRLYSRLMLHIHRSNTVDEINTTSVLKYGTHISGHRKIALDFDNVKQVNEQLE